MTEAAWIVGGASRQGAAHKRRNQPNQDAVHWILPPNGTRSFAAAVADGHGSDAFYRSDVGAELAVEVATSLLAPYLEGPPPDTAALVLALVAGWREAVQKHAESVDQGWVDLERDVAIPYGTTLLVSAITPDWALAMQIGDGDLCWGYADGQVIRPLPDEDGLVGEQTRSLCLPDAAERTRFVLRIAASGESLPDFAMISTDGVSKSFYAQDGFLQTASEFRAAARRQGAAVLPALADWLDKVSEQGSGDDVTLCLASCAVPGKD
jgi:hypothetical protein